MKITKYLALILLCAGLFAPLLQADVIVFKSGKEILVKKVWEEDGNYCCYRFGRLVKYPKVTIESIRTGEAASLRSVENATAALSSSNSSSSFEMPASFVPRDFPPPISNVPVWKCMASENAALPKPRRVRTNYTKPGAARAYMRRAFVLARAGNAQDLKDLIDRHPEILHQVDFTGKSLAMHAAEGGGLEVLQYLAGKGLDINAGDDSGNTALHYTASGNTDNHAACAAFLVKNGAETELLNDPGRSEYNNVKEGTPLMLAVHKKHLNVAKALVFSGANINAQNSYGYTALHHACMYWDPDGCGKIKFLLNYGASLDIQNMWGLKPVEAGVDRGLRSWLANMFLKMERPMPEVPVLFGEVRAAIFEGSPKAGRLRYPDFHKIAVDDGRVKSRRSKYSPKKGSKGAAAIKALLNQNPELARQRDRFGRTLYSWVKIYDYPAAENLFQDS